MSKIFHIWDLDRKLQKQCKTEISATNCTFKIYIHLNVSDDCITISRFMDSIHLLLVTVGDNVLANISEPFHLRAKENVIPEMFSSLNNRQQKILTNRIILSPLKI